MPNKKPFYIYFLPLLFISFFSTIMFGQENPPIPIQVEVNTSQHLNFGSFTAGTAGGTVTVGFGGQRTVDGDIVGLNLGQPVSAALFDVYALPGTIIQIEDYGTYDLTNQDTGMVISLVINSFSTLQRTFVTEKNPQEPNPVYIGGTLNIPADNSGNLPGRYFGTFTLNFIHE